MSDNADYVTSEPVIHHDFNYPKQVGVLRDDDPDVAVGDTITLADPGSLAVRVRVTKRYGSIFHWQPIGPWLDWDEDGKTWNAR